jgi:hypothetical protein
MTLYYPYSPFLLCKLCHQLMDGPTLTECCATPSCANCVEPLVRKNHCCPFCATPLCTSELHYNQVIEDAIQAARALRDHKQKEIISHNEKKQRDIKLNYHMGSTLYLPPRANYGTMETGSAAAEESHH